MRLYAWRMLLDIFRPASNDRLRIRKGKVLLKSHAPAIIEIRSLVGLPLRQWRALYQTTLENLADYLQELPASEAHHHTEPGGLLTHSIETAVQALRIRRGKLLPPNADAETITRYKDVWTYAVFTAALCHDIGKPLTDLSVELFNKRNHSIGAWSPFAGAMTTQENAVEYQVRYRRKRQYPLHERASALYLHHIIPTIGVEWLANYSGEVFYHWTNCLTAHREDAGPIGDIAQEADRRSVASNLAGDQVDTRSLSQQSTTRPLYQRMLTSLRLQLDEGRLPLNRDGAAGWIVEDKLWLVVKRALDQIRDHMTRQGQTGIPARNDRFMDELQQYGLLIPNSDRAVWKCRVFAPGWSKAHELTMLCLPTIRVWTAEDSEKKTFSRETADTATLNPSQQDDADPDIGLRFLHWLREGLHQREFPVNDVNSRIHRTAEGLLLVSPVIFRQFDPEKWSYAQKRFTRLKLHERNANGTNIHEYLATGKKKKSLIKGFLINDTGNVFPGIELPAINHKLSKVAA